MQKGTIKKKDTYVSNPNVELRCNITHKIEFGVFRKDIKDYAFKERHSTKVLETYIIYAKYRHSEKSLLSLIANQHPDYEQVYAPKQWEGWQEKINLKRKE